MGLVLPGRPRVYRGITGLERDTPPVAASERKGREVGGGGTENHPGQWLQAAQT